MRRRFHPDTDVPRGRPRLSAPTPSERLRTITVRRRAVVSSTPARLDRARSPPPSRNRRERGHAIKHDRWWSLSLSLLNPLTAAYFLCTIRPMKSTYPTMQRFMPADVRNAKIWNRFGSSHCIHDEGSHDSMHQRLSLIVEKCMRIQRA